MRTVRKFEMHKPEGTFADLLEVYGWLQRLRVADHKFNINISIIDTKEDK